MMSATMSPTPSESKLVPSTDPSFADALIGLAPHLRSFAKRLTGNVTNAEDLVQETLLKAWRARQSFTPDTNIRAWAFTILRNAHFSALRRRRWEGNWTDELDWSLGHEEHQSASTELKQVLALIQRLPIDQRVALQLVAIEQLSYKAAAVRVGVAIGTMKSRVGRARAELTRLSDGGSSPLKTSETWLGAGFRDVAPDGNVDDSASAATPKSALAQWRLAKAAGERFLIGAAQSPQEAR